MVTVNRSIVVVNTHDYSEIEESIRNQLSFESRKTNVTVIHSIDNAGKSLITPYDVDCIILVMPQESDIELIRHCHELYHHYALPYLVITTNDFIEILSKQYKLNIPFYLLRKHLTQMVFSSTIDLAIATSLRKIADDATKKIGIKKQQSISEQQLAQVVEKLKENFHIKSMGLIMVNYSNGDSRNVMVEKRIVDFTGKVLRSTDLVFHLENGNIAILLLNKKQQINSLIVVNRLLNRFHQLTLELDKKLKSSARYNFFIGFANSSDCERTANLVEYANMSLKKSMLATSSNYTIYHSA